MWIVCYVAVAPVALLQCVVLFTYDSGLGAGGDQIMITLQCLGR